MSCPIMAEPREHTSVQIARIGAIAREILSVDGPCEVIAVFDRSFYLACPVGIVCVGRDIGSGPINLEVASIRSSLGTELDWLALNIASGVEGTVNLGLVRLSSGLALDVGKASEWTPPPPPIFVTTHAIDGVAQLRAAAHGAAPADGLARLVLCGDAAGHTARAAKGAIDALCAGLPRNLACNELSNDVARAATLLLGMGPGLTPSGDDLLGGVMLSLTAAGHAPIRDALWHNLEPELNELTVPISAMHLSAAADGMAGERLHALLEGVMGGDEASLATAIDELSAVGHTSGWDAAAGIALGLEAVIASRGWRDSKGQA